MKVQYTMEVIYWGEGRTVIPKRCQTSDSQFPSHTHTYIAITL